MLQRRNRLRRNAEIQHVRRKGVRRRVQMAAMYVLANELGTSRFAISAGRRVGNAVVRNRTKRRAREIIRRHMHEISQGWDCLLILTPASAMATYAEVEADLLRLLARAQLLKHKEVRTADCGNT